MRQSLAIFLLAALSVHSEAQDSPNREHFFPLIADGGGFRSRLFVTGVSDAANRCSLLLRGPGLNAGIFTVGSAVTVIGTGAEIDLGGGGVTLTSAGGRNLAFGYVTLDCAEPTVARMLLSLESGATLLSLATLESATPGMSFQFPVLPRLGRLALVFSSEAALDVACAVELEDEAGASIGGGSIAVPAGSTALGFLDELIPIPHGFDTGKARVSCDRLVAAVGLLLNGPVFTALSATILEDDSASSSHILPLIQDGGGFRSRVLLTNLAESANRCTVDVRGGGLDAGRFDMPAGASASDSGIVLELAARGDQASLPSTGEQALAYGYAAVECDGPVDVRNLLTVEVEGKLAGLAAVPGVRPAGGAEFPILPELGQLVLAMSNASVSALSCTADLSRSGNAAAETRQFGIASRSTSVRFLDDLFTGPEDFSHGAVKLDCDGAFSAIALLQSGAVFAAMPSTPASGLERTAAATAGSERESVDFLLHGVVDIGMPGMPGALCVYGPDAFPLVQGASGSASAPVAAASSFGAGRIVAMSHDGYFKRATIDTADTGLLLTNALQWVAGEKSPPRVGVAQVQTDIVDVKALRSWLSEAGYDSVEVALTPDALASVDVLFVAMWNQTDLELDALREFMRSGGGVVTAATGWGWASLHPHRNLVTDYAGNRLLAPVGIQWADYEHNPRRTSESGYAVSGAPNALTHGLEALDALEEYSAGRYALTVDEADQAFATLERTAGCLPPNDNLFAPRLRDVLESANVKWPSADNVVDKNGVTGRLAAIYEIEQRRRPAEQVRAHPASADFPGSVPDEAERIARRLDIDSTVPRWHSTGLYAAPGERVTVTAPPAVAESGDWHVRVGAHTDSLLWWRSEFKRMPEISRRFAVSDVTTLVANAFGGLIYIEVPDDAGLGTVSIEIEGAVAAPRFVLGETDPAEWRNGIRDAPAPWGEIEGKNMIVTTESDELRALDDPTDVARVWDRILDLNAELAAWTEPRKYPERFVVDRQISIGWMHAGYPMMAHIEGGQSAYIADARHISTCRQEWTGSNWGFFHEVGHNHQSADWTFEGTVEVTVNLFTLYVYEFLCGIPVAENWRGSPAFRAEQMDRYDFDDPDFGQWKNDPFLALVMYEQLQQEFGWEAFRQVFAEYRNLEEADRPKSDDGKRDQWLVRFSRTVGRNLGPFFQAWGVPTSQAARDEVSGLPVWLPEGFPPG